MNKFKIFGLVLLTSVSVSQAQDINQAKKAIDAEKYEDPLLTFIPNQNSNYSRRWPTLLANHQGINNALPALKEMLITLNAVPRTQQDHL